MVYKVVVAGGALVIFLGALLFGALALHAAPDDDNAVAKKKQKIKASIVPKPPQLVYVFPAGGKRGSTFEAQIHGVDFKDVKSVHISGVGVTASIIPPPPPAEPAKPGDKTAKPDTKAVKKKTPKKERSKNPLEIKTEVVRVSITVAADAPLGERDLRLFTPNGLSNRLRFLVGQLPEVTEVEPNDTLEEAQSLPALPVLVNGQLTAGDVDVFRFQAKAGQTLVCQLQGRCLMPFVAEAVPGWLQGVLTLFDKEGRQLIQEEDAHTCLDPVLIYKIQKDGDYFVEVRDAIYRGTPKFVYRLSIGSLPYIQSIFPLGGHRGTKVDVQLTGVNLPGDRLKFEVPADGHRTQVGVTNGGLASNTLPFAISDDEELQESEPNDSLEKANPIKSGAVVNGRIDHPGDVDYFEFTAAKGETFVFDVVARRLGSPLDSYLAVLNAAGKQLADNDDWIDEWEQLITHQADSHLVFTCPAAGKYYLRLSDVQGHGAKDYAYRLSMAPPRPDFLLRVMPDNPAAGGGDAALMRVQVVRRDGFNGKINLALKGVPDGVTVSRTFIERGRSECVVGIAAAANAKPATASLQLVGTAVIGGQTVTRVGVPSEELQQAFAYQHYLPTGEFLLTVSEPAPAFTVAAQLGAGKVVEVPAGGKAAAEFVMKINRQEGWNGAIRFTAAGDVKKIRGIKNALPPLTIAGAALKDETQATIKVTALSRAVVGDVYDVVISGTLKVGKEDVVRSTIVPVKIIAKKVEKADNAGKVGSIVVRQLRAFARAELQEPRTKFVLSSFQTLNAR